MLYVYIHCNLIALTEDNQSDPVTDEAHWNKSPVNGEPAVIKKHVNIASFTQYAPFTHYPVLPSRSLHVSGTLPLMNICGTPHSSSICSTFGTHIGTYIHNSL